MEARLTRSQDAQCNSCERYKARPKLGHIHCSVHRECTGDLQWEPNKCKYCFTFKEEYTLMTSEKRNSFLQRPKGDALNNAYQLQGTDINWGYRMVVCSFLEAEEN